MKIEARIFELLTAFFLIGAVVYTVLTGLSSKGVEWAGATAFYFSGGLTLIIGTYFRFVARRVRLRRQRARCGLRGEPAGAPARNLCVRRRVLVRLRHVVVAGEE